MRAYRGLLKSLGPGILFASTCIGVSHLVQSTRAGAAYGFSLLLAVIFANIFKFPFFEFAARYTSATGVSIIDGYFKRGRWILAIYFAITLVSMFVVSAAVTFVTAGLLSNLIGLEISTNIWAAIILAVCVVLLGLGQYKHLDKLLKGVGFILLVSVLVAFFSALFHGRAPQVPGFDPKEVLSEEGIIFLIALMGWMPTAVDISTWTSLWGEAKIKQSGYRATMREALFDFNFGYWTSAILAVCFLTLGAYIIYGTGIELSNSSPTFADQLINMFTAAIGDWSYYVIAIAAFSTMFSTTITVVDGYCRAMTRTVSLLVESAVEQTRRPYLIWTVLVALGTYFIVSQYLNSLKQLVDLATIVSFVIGPLAGYLNYRVIFAEEVGPQFRPAPWLRNLAIAGLIFLSVFTLIFLWVKVDSESIVALLKSFS